MGKHLGDLIHQDAGALNAGLPVTHFGIKGNTCADFFISRLLAPSLLYETQPMLDLVTYGVEKPEFYFVIGYPTSHAGLSFRNSVLCSAST